MIQTLVNLKTKIKIEFYDLCQDPDSFQSEIIKDLDSCIGEALLGDTFDLVINPETQEDFDKIYNMLTTEYKQDVVKNEDGDKEYDCGQLLFSSGVNAEDWDKLITGFFGEDNIKFDIS